MLGPNHIDLLAHACCSHLTRCCWLQDDLLYESLTVWETLWFAAQLRLPRTMSKAAKRERVDAVITALGLSRCRDTIIGEQGGLCKL